MVSPQPNVIDEAVRIFRERVPDSDISDSLLRRLLGQRLAVISLGDSALEVIDERLDRKVQLFSILMPYIIEDQDATWEELIGRLSSNDVGRLEALLGDATIGEFLA